MKDADRMTSGIETHQIRFRPAPLDGPITRGGPAGRHVHGHERRCVRSLLVPDPHLPQVAILVASIKAAQLPERTLPSPMMFRRLL